MNTVCAIKLVWFTIKLNNPLFTPFECISVCGFGRSLNMDCENQEKDKDGNPTAPGTFNNGGTNNSELYEQASDTISTPKSPAVFVDIINLKIATGVHY